MEGCTEGWMMVNFETANNFGLDVYFGGTSGLWVGGSYFVFFLCRSTSQSGLSI